MSSLVIVLLSIALIAVFFTAGMNYINPEKMFSRSDAIEISTTFSTLSSALSDYRHVYRSLPTVPDPLETDPNNWQWRTQLSDFITLPKPAERWVYGKDSATNKYYFCFEGPLDKTQYHAARRIVDNATTGSIELTDNCGGAQNSTEPASFPASLSVTYWVTQ